MSAEIERQLDVLAARSVDLVSRDLLRRKLEYSRQQQRPLRIKLGADPSAPDLHLGHCVVLNKLREFQDMGHRVVFIIGDFTGMIGDPSGKSVTRPSLSREQIQANAGTYQQQVFKILDRRKTEVRFNSEWFGNMTFEEVIRLSARVTVAQMLARDDFSRRYAANQSISLVEFLYPLVQAYDSVMVKADVELGGTDQVFNLLLGREIQQSHGQEPQVIMTLPLLEGLDGVQKMSKSLDNYIGVTDDPRAMYGKAMSVSDDLMWRYFELLLCTPAAELAELRADVGAGRRHPRDVKDRMARDLVALFHDRCAADEAAAEFSRVFASGGLPDELPEVKVDAIDADGRIGLLTLMVSSGLARSNGEGRRLVQQGGVRIDDQKISDPGYRLEPREGMILRVGKRRCVRLVC